MSLGKSTVGPTVRNAPMVAMPMIGPMAKSVAAMRWSLQVAAFGRKDQRHRMRSHDPAGEQADTITRRLLASGPHFGTV